MKLILEQQARHLHERNYTSLMFNLITGTVLCFILRDHVDHFNIAVWFSLMIMANIIRFSISAYYNNKDMSDIEFLRSLMFYAGGMFTTQLVWGASTFFIFPADSPMHQMFLAFILAGVLARATPILSVNKHLYRAFIFIVLSPLILHFAIFPTSEVHLVMVFMLLVYGVTLYKSATFLGSSFERLFDLSSQLKGQATRDGLTGISNRFRFDEFLSHEWRSAVRNKQSISLLMLDIDAFKAYNDTYGHLAGDTCIRTVAKVVEKSVLRSTDFVARYGGEEFAVILPGSDIKGAEAVAERIRHHVEVLHIPNENSSVGEYVTVSVGAASLVPNEDDKLEDFIEVADQNLYKCKQAGRNRISVVQIENGMLAHDEVPATA